MHKLVVLLTGIAVLGIVNYSIYEKEQVLSGGRVVLLKLAPVDPRSLMQGDYMALRFALAASVPNAANLRDGFLVVTLDGNGVAELRRVDNGQPLSTGELRIRYRVRNSQIKLGTNAFFFQEGDANYYTGAQYGEARIGANGELLLTGLRSEDFKTMGPN